VRTTAPPVMIAVRLDSPAAVDAQYNRLHRRGITFQAEPTDYPWSARCAYFTGPDHELWKLYAWHEGGRGAVGRSKGDPSTTGTGAGSG
jgi:uncharacterized protein